MNKETQKISSPNLRGEGNKGAKTPPKSSEGNKSSSKFSERVSTNKGLRAATTPPKVSR